MPEVPYKDIPRPFSNTGYTPPVTPDQRNFIYEKAVPTAPFPESYITDISQIPVYHQYQIPDCVENAVTFIKRYYDWYNTKQVNDYARRFLAILTVLRDGFPLSEGTSVENAMYLAYKVGICDAALLDDNHDTDIATFDNPSLITQALKDNAASHKAGNYAFLTDLTANGLKHAIYQNGVILVGAKINQNWWTDTAGNVTWEASKILPIRPPKSTFDPTISGHAFVLFGYANITPTELKGLQSGLITIEDIKKKYAA